MTARPEPVRRVAEAMAGKRGVGFRTVIDTPDVKRWQNVDLCGIVQNLLPPVKIPAGDQFQLTFDLIDDDENTVKCRIYRVLDELPKLTKDGQIVFLKRMQIDDTDVGRLVVSTPTSSWEVQEAAPGVLKTLPAQKPSASKRFTLFKDFNVQGAGSFHDLLGEVVKIYYDASRDIVEIYITDWTEHANLHEYVAGTSEWPGPAGRLSLRVDLFPPHSAFVKQSVKVEDRVYLTNVRVKWSPSGELEGSIFKDTRYPNKVCVSVCHYGPQLEELQARKRAVDEAINKQQKTSKATGKKARQRARNKEREKQEQRDGSVEGSKDTPVLIETEEGNATSKLAIEPKLNPNVVYIGPHEFSDYSSVKDILENPARFYTTKEGESVEMPFVNCKHRSLVRVVDFFPHDIKQFTKRSPISANRWIWDFWLVVRDTTYDASNLDDDEQAHELNLRVSGSDATALLGLAAQDLTSKANAKLMNNLKEKLFLLWGELAEKKDKFFQAHPHIKADQQFSAITHNITTDSLPCVVGIKELGEERLKSTFESSAYHMINETKIL